LTTVLVGTGTTPPNAHCGASGTAGADAQHRTLLTDCAPHARIGPAVPASPMATPAISGFIV
jgi:hypothetical protein